MLGIKLRFFDSFLKNRQHRLWRKFWNKILNIPRSQIRIYMLLLHNGNRMHNRDLVDELLSNGFSDSKNYCKLAIKRACRNHVLHEDKAGYVSVEEPVCFIFKLMRGDVFDNWKVLILPTLILTILFARIDPLLTILFGVASLAIVVAWFIEDKVNTVKF